MELKPLQNNENFIIKELPVADKYYGDYELYHAGGKFLTDVKYRFLGVPTLSDEIEFNQKGCYVKKALSQDPESADVKYQHLFFDNKGNNIINLRDANINNFGYNFGDNGTYSLKFFTGGVLVNFKESAPKVVSGRKRKKTNAPKNEEHSVYLNYQELKRLVLLSDNNFKKIYETGLVDGVPIRNGGGAGGPNK